MHGADFGWYNLEDSQDTDASKMKPENCVELAKDFESIYDDTWNAETNAYYYIRILKPGRISFTIKAVEDHNHASSSKRNYFTFIIEDVKEYNVTEMTQKKERRKTLNEGLFKDSNTYNPGATTGGTQYTKANLMARKIITQEYIPKNSSGEDTTTSYAEGQSNALFQIVSTLSNCSDPLIEGNWRELIVENGKSYGIKELNCFSDNNTNICVKALRNQSNAKIGNQTINIEKDQYYLVTAGFICYPAIRPNGKILYNIQEIMPVEVTENELNLTDEQREQLAEAGNALADAMQEVRDDIDTYTAIFHFDAEAEQERIPTEFDDIFDHLENYIPADSVPNSNVKERTSIVLTIITNIGMLISIIMLAVIGIKYMLGSVEEKAEYKKDLIPYLIGAILLFGITTFVKVFQQFGESINNF